MTASTLWVVVRDAAAARVVGEVTRLRLVARGGRAGIGGRDFPFLTIGHWSALAVPGLGFDRVSYSEPPYFDVSSPVAPRHLHLPI